MAAQPFVTFASLLRANGFAVAPEQTQSFLIAVDLLGPRAMRDIYRAAVATLAPSPDRRDTFDALYRLHFLGQSMPDLAEAAAEPDELTIVEERDGQAEPPQADELAESGAEATAAERLSLRSFGASADSLALARLLRRAPADLPRRRSRRFRAAHTGNRPDLRRTLRRAVMQDGEMVEMPYLKRRLRQRRIVLLIDVSGSMKRQTESTMRFAHAVARAANRIEVFTLGTRLTRVTRALKLRSTQQALAVAGTLVADWDGGTRLGDALTAFLEVPRFAGLGRGAFVIVLSDGLERGDTAVLTAAMVRFHRMAWAVLWLTPLARDAAFRPETDALKAISPFVDRFGQGGSITAMADEVMTFTRRAA
jgi:uncharacterized protein with von Willebrand factor type A (vWA) domain